MKPAMSEKDLRITRIVMAQIDSIIHTPYGMISLN
jgi:hypothetical protein